MHSSCVFRFLLFHSLPFSEVVILDRNSSNVVTVVSEKSGGTDEKSGHSFQDELRFQIPSRAVVGQWTSPDDDA